MQSNDGNKDNLSDFMKHQNGVVKEYYNNYIANAPEGLLNSIKIIEIKKNTVFVREGTDVDSVYILIDGMVKAIDYRFLGNSYDYMWFYPIKNFGGMEIFLDLVHYQTSLSTMTACKMLVISKDKFKKWVKNDMNLLSMEVKAMGTHLLEEAKRNRIYLFMQGSDRVIYILTQIFEQTSDGNTCTIKLTHQDLSDSIGLSVKTINRSLKKLELENYISRLGNKIVISNNQYAKMKDIINPVHGI